MEHVPDDTCYVPFSRWFLYVQHGSGDDENVGFVGSLLLLFIVSVRENKQTIGTKSKQQHTFIPVIATHEIRH